MPIYRARPIPPQIIVGVGVGLSGLSQAILLFAPSASLQVEELAQLALWVSLAGGIGILVSSIVSNSLFFRIVKESSNGGDSDDINKTTISLFTFTAVICILLYFSRVLFFDRNIDLMAFLLSISIFLQFLASVQRSYYAGQARWAPLSGQMAIDGILRVVSTFTLIFFGNVSISTLLLLSILSQIGSITLVTTFAKWGANFSMVKPSFIKMAKESWLLFIAASGSLVVTTFVPVIMKLLDGSPQVIAITTGLLIIARVPSSVLLPITIPVIRDQASLAYSGNRVERNKLLRNTTVKLLSYSLILALLIQLTIKAMPLALLDLSIISNLSNSTYALVVLISLAFVQEGFKTTILNSFGKFSAVALIYAGVIPIFLWMMSLVKDSVDFVMLLIATASLTVAAASRYHGKNI